MRCALLLSMVAVLVWSSACRFGDARFESTFEGRGFDPGGTVFSYVDGHDDNLVEEGDPRVVLVMTWIVFDPTRELNDIDGAALASMAHEMEVRDALAVTFDRQGAVDAGERFSVIIDGDVQTSERALQASLHLAPERLDERSSYAAFEPLASRRTVKVDVETASFGDAAAILAGTMEIDFETVDGRDPGDAVEGVFHGEFHAPVVPERTAESNLALLGASRLLGVPLPPRAVP